MRKSVGITHQKPNPIDFSYWNVKAVYEMSILILLKEQKKKYEEVGLLSDLSDM